MKNVGKFAALALLIGAGFLSQETVSAASHTIREGESFYSIAQTYGIDPQELAASNGYGLYDLILPGQALTLPATVVETSQPVAASTSSYTVQLGDSFSSIAALYGMDLYQLAANNGLRIDDYLLPGQVLQVVASAPVQQAETASSSYYLEGYDYEPGINYPIGQCTWAVQKLTGWAGDWWGNASTWADNAAREGFAVGHYPAVGAIVVWNDGGFGHVAYVTAVESATNIQVLEANVNGRQWIDNHRGWINPLQTSSQVAYIYPPAY